MAGKKFASRLSNFIIPESGRDRNLCASKKWCFPAPPYRSASLFHQPMYLLVITRTGNPMAPATRLQNSAQNRLLRVVTQARNNFSKPTRTKGNILRHREPLSKTPGRRTFSVARMFRDFAEMSSRPGRRHRYRVDVAYASGVPCRHSWRHPLAPISFADKYEVVVLE